MIRADVRVRGPSRCSKFKHEKGAHSGTRNLEGCASHDAGEVHVASLSVDPLIINDQCMVFTQNISKLIQENLLLFRLHLETIPIVYSLTCQEFLYS